MVLVKQRTCYVALLMNHLLPRGYRYVAQQANRNSRKSTSFADPLTTVGSENPYQQGNVEFQSTVIDTSKRKILKQIVRLSREGTSRAGEELDDLYSLGEEYLELENESRILEPSHDSIVQKRISEFLEKRFNYNPLYVQNEHSKLPSEVSVDQCSDTRDMSYQSNQEHTDDGALSQQMDMYETKPVQSVSEHDRDQKSSEDTMRRLMKGLLPNGTIVKFDPKELKSYREENVADSVFDDLGSVICDEELIKQWSKTPIIEAVYYNGALLPRVVSDLETEYSHMRNKAILLNNSHVLAIEVYGDNAGIFLDQFVTCSLDRMKNNTLQYTCVVDSKGFVMDTAYVAKTCNRFLLLTSGLHKRSLYDYMTAYQVTCRNSGVKANINPLLSSTIISIQGPTAIDVFNQICSKGSENLVDSSDSTVGGIPCIGQEVSLCKIRIEGGIPEYMGVFNGVISYNGTSVDGSTNIRRESFYCMRVGDVGEDGIECLVSTKVAPLLVSLLLESPEVTPAGFETYDCGRMEAGIIRSDVDLHAEPSPIQASVAWSIDTHKLRFGSFFGQKHMMSQMMHGVAKIRVGLITSTMVDNTCKILNSDTRMPIGFVSSCAWSPGLQMYLAQAYVRKEYARHDMPVYLSMPCKPEKPTTKREYRKYYRHMTIRKLSRGTVVHLPFVYHNYVVEEAQRYNTGGRNVPLQGKGRHSEVRMTQCISEDQANDVVKQSELMAEVQDPSNNTREHVGGAARVKTRKQLWKEVIARQRKLSAKTLQRAIEDLERSTVSVTKPQDGTDAIAHCAELLRHDRINLKPRAEVSPENVIAYYREIHEVPVMPRHRRYRPPVGLRQK